MVILDGSPDDRPGDLQPNRRRAFVFGKRGVVVTLLAATTINFIDRQTLSVLAPVLQQEMGISEIDYAKIVNSFLSVYSVMYLLSGRLVDRLGTRLGLGLAVIWWSSAQMLHALCTDVASLCVVRALLAIGEAAVIPTAVKSVAEWFEIRERGLAISVFEAGLSLGPMLAPPLVVWISLRFGWRAAFVATGLAGFVLASVWLVAYRTPATSVARTSGESREAAAPISAWRELFRTRAIWGIGLTRIFGDPIWYFYLFWLPKYFGDAKNLSLSSIGAFVWIPYFASMLGGFVGGGAAGWLIRRGVSPIRARQQVMLASSVVVSCGVFSVFTESLPLVLLAVGAGAFALQVWGINVETLPTDVFSPQKVGFAVGLCGFLGGVAFTAVTGYVVHHYSYTPIWIASTVMYPIGWFLSWLLLRTTAELSAEPIPSPAH